MNLAAAAIFLFGIAEEKKTNSEPYDLYKKKDTSLKDGVSRPDDEVSRFKPGVDSMRKDMKAARQETPEVLDSLESLLALTAQGTDGSCARLDSLQQQLSQGFDAVMQTIKDEAARRDACELKTNLDALTEAYERITEDKLSAAKRENNALPECTNNDVKKAKESANNLYRWARNFVPKNAESAQEATWQEKLNTMPYVTAMAYAARVKVRTHILERDMAEEEEDKKLFLNRAHETVKEFIDVLSVALDGLMADTSLLEIALIYQRPLATYITLMTNFRSLVDDLLAQSTETENVAVWDDGLSSIRAALHWKTGDDPLDQTIQLYNIKESLWWFTFIDTDYESMDISTIRKSIDIRELCHVLGAADDEQSAHIALKPGQKGALLELPSASALRDALCDKIAQARQAEPPQSFARINRPLPLGQIMHGDTATAPRTLTGHTKSVRCVAMCPDGKRVVSGSSDGTARVWSLSNGQHLRTFSGHEGALLCVVVSPDGKRAVSGSHDKSVRVWSVDSSSAQYTLQDHSDYVWAVAVSPDGHTIASGSWDMTVKLWNMYTRECQATLKGHDGFLYCVAFSPDGEALVSGSADKSIKVWNVHTGVLQHTIYGHFKPVRGVAVTPDGRRVVSGSEDKTVRVWSLNSGAEEMMFDHEQGVSCVAVFPDGQRIVSGSEDNTVRVWNLRSKALELTLVGHSDTVLSVAVSPDGRNVVSGSDDETIKVWALSDSG